MLRSLRRAAAPQGMLRGCALRFQSTDCRIIVSNSTNPFFNIAFEQYLFNSPASAEEKVLYLWRNEPSVIIGRFQGAWKECRVQAMDADKVHLVRLSSANHARQFLQFRIVALTASGGVDDTDLHPIRFCRL